VDSRSAANLNLGIFGSVSQTSVHKRYLFDKHFN
jgi:hypothetical protein